MEEIIDEVYEIIDIEEKIDFAPDICCYPFNIICY